MAEAASDEYDPEDQQFSYAMQIATREDGYNSGRIYYLSTSSKEELDDLIEFLSQRAHLARKHFESRTWFRKLQMNIRAKYDSRTFQSFMALLIIAVSKIHANRTYYSTKLHGDLNRNDRTVLSGTAGRVIALNPAQRFLSVV